jgi:UDP-N-acetylglucosamine/UDP-N-acetylgalactosamine diphosphorylase
MTEEVPQTLQSRLARHGQQHLLRWTSELSDDQRRQFDSQVDAIDFDRIASLVKSHGQSAAHNEVDSIELRAQRANSPASIVRLPASSEDRDRWEQARRAGEELLKSGQVGAILVAGGQGTRLGFDHPKGIYPIGPVSRSSLFQILAEQVLARSRRAAKPIPYFVMTSDATHEPTVAYFAENRNFGLPRDDVYFFSQGNMPAVDAQTGQLLMADKAQLSTSPDGHGGILAALAKAGLLDVMARRGIEFLHYHQVDNPTAIVCDPVFLGFHVLFKSDMSTKVVAKRTAEERMGVVVDVDGRTQVIEYSDLPAEVARKTDDRGQLLLWAGNTAIHVFSRRFLDRIVDSDAALPFHVARKKVAYCDEQGHIVNPQKENAYKFERFIFDALPLAERALVLETDRKREFNPVKNASGDDSPQTTQTALVALHRSWLQAAGAVCDENDPIEISPLFALDADEVRGKVKPQTRFTGPTFLK